MMIVGFSSDSSSPSRVAAMSVGSVHDSLSLFLGLGKSDRICDFGQVVGTRIRLLALRLFAIALLAGAFVFADDVLEHSLHVACRVCVIWEVLLEDLVVLIGLA